MKVIEISENKFGGLLEHVEKIVKSGKKLLECFEELEEGMGERGGYGNREDDDDDYDDDDMGERGGYGSRGGYGRGIGMGQRRGVRGTGRYSRFR